MALVVANQKNMQGFLGLGTKESKEIAQELKRAAGDSTAVDSILEKLNKRLNGFGIESIEGDYQVDRYYYNIVLLYVNKGDTYDETFLYETDTGKFYVGSWGDWVELKGKKYRVE